MGCLIVLVCVLAVLVAGLYTGTPIGLLVLFLLWAGQKNARRKR